MSRSGGVQELKAEELAGHVARGLSVREAATRAGIAYRTAQRWASDPLFVARVGTLRASLMGDTLDKVTGGMSFAVDKLRELLTHKDAAIQVRAAVALLNSGIRLCEHAEIVDRVEQLERLLEASQNQQGRGRT